MPISAIPTTRARIPAPADVIASLVGGQIQLYDPKAGDPTGVFLAPPSGLAVKNFTWMPDGTAIAFTVGY
jgi:hypothetical protein